MPLLAAEPALFPDNLLESGAESAEAGSGWWVLHTRPRSEKSLTRRLLALGVGYYLPTRHQQWRAKSRNFESFLPLFPGYVFLHAPVESRPTVLATGMVANFLPVVEQEKLSQDLRQIHRVLSAGLPVEHQVSLIPGEPVHVIDGPLRGLTGRMVRQCKMTTVCIEVRLIAQGVRVELDSALVRPFTAIMAC